MKVFGAIRRSPSSKAVASPSRRNGLIQVLNCCAGNSCSKRCKQDSQKPAIDEKAPPRAFETDFDGGY
jgi:hypothetical protein